MNESEITTNSYRLCQAQENSTTQIMTYLVIGCDWLEKHNILSDWLNTLHGILSPALAKESSRIPLYYIGGNSLSRKMKPGINIKEENKDAKIYVGRSTPRPWTIFYFALIHYALVTFLLCFVHGQGQKLRTKTYKNCNLSGFITIAVHLFKH